MSSKKFKKWLNASLSRISDCSGSIAIGLVDEIVRGVGVFKRGFIRDFFPISGEGRSGERAVAYRAENRGDKERR